MKRLILSAIFCVAASLIGAALVGAAPANAKVTAHDLGRPPPRAAAPAKVRTISGTVGPSFTISMARKRTHAGLYAITIHDKGSIHNFHLTGPGGVDRKTGISFTGTKTWNVRLRVGTYRFQCDPHADMMHGTLVVFGG
jgi:plastocyanin